MAQNTLCLESREYEIRMKIIYKHLKLELLRSIIYDLKKSKI
jgi:hypothetical protein